MEQERVGTTIDGVADHRSTAYQATEHADDPAVTAATNAVAVARHRLQHVRRAFMRRECGSTDVAIAEHDLSRALDRLDRANGNAS